MDISLKNIKGFFRGGRSRAASSRNPVVTHWELLLGFFIILLLLVTLASIFAYNYFLLGGGGAPVIGGGDEGRLLDEKKLKEVVTRITEKEKKLSEGNAGTAQFVDPSIPF